MAQTKLVNMDPWALEIYAVDAMPAHLATSHAWSYGMFAINTEYLGTVGGRMIESTVRSRFPDTRYCWIDTLGTYSDWSRNTLASMQLKSTGFEKATFQLVNRPAVHITVQISAAMWDSFEDYFRFVLPLLRSSIDQ
jgi:hypothetical protein